MQDKKNWQKFCKYFFQDEELGLQLDISEVNFSEDYFKQMEPQLKEAYTRMKKLEAGAVANPDENRMVGHYWLRAPELAPNAALTTEIRNNISNIKEFAERIHQGTIRSERGTLFKKVLLIGIGGSSLGPRFVSEALNSRAAKMELFFIDNTDPDGMDRIFEIIGEDLPSTLTVVISKSGGTIETRNGMEETRHFYSKQGLDFTKHAISITQPGSLLDRLSIEQGWLGRFPMWDWVGGRTSVLSAVGLVPLALQGVDIDLLLAGARRCDSLTRSEHTLKNPAALLALMWYKLTGGQGGKQMVILPYKDRLELLTKYMQQLIMESLGKEKDLSGEIVNQGIAVFGNKGTTDQHSYLQQLLDGPANFFVTFIEVLKDREFSSPFIAEESTSGDYLHAFLLGTRKALATKQRESITVTLTEISERTIGALLALFERTVSIYADLININAYHQPAVELGKKGAGEVIRLKNKLVNFLRANPNREYRLEEIAELLADSQIDLVILFKILQHLCHNPESQIIFRKAKPVSTADKDNGYPSYVYQYKQRLNN